MDDLARWFLAVQHGSLDDGTQLLGEDAALVRKRQMLEYLAILVHPTTLPPQPSRRQEAPLGPFKKMMHGSSEMGR